MKLALNKFLVLFLKVFLSVFFINIIYFLHVIILGLGFFEEKFQIFVKPGFYLLMFPCVLFWPDQSARFPFIQGFVFPAIVYAVFITFVIVCLQRILRLRR